MHENLRGRLIESLGRAVPDYVEQYIDRANDLYRRVGYGDAPWQVMPLLLLMAELEHEGSHRATEPRRQNVDLRTREGRALKTAGAI